MSNTKTILTEDILNSFISILTVNTGIVPRAGHREGIKNFIENKLKDNKLSIEEYRKQLLTDKALISEFVNQSTINETYFFREEKQFSLLQDKIFVQWKLKNPGKELRIWSAACSYGEEAYSLAILAKTCGIVPRVTASDINSDVLKHCKSGVFLGTSLRSVDGVPFQKLLLPYRRVDGRVAFPEETKKQITTMQLNLSELDLPEN